MGYRDVVAVIEVVEVELCSVCRGGGGGCLLVAGSDVRDDRSRQKLTQHSGAHQIWQSCWPFWEMEINPR